MTGLRLLIVSVRDLRTALLGGQSLPAASRSPARTEGEGASRREKVGVLVRIRAALAELAELVAELLALTPEDQEVPDTTAADHAVRFVVTGERPVIMINFTVQHAADGGQVVDDRRRRRRR